MAIPQGMPIQPEQLRIGDIPVTKSRWVTPGTFMIVGEFPKPRGWEIATDEERMRYAVAHGAQVIIHGDRSET